MSELRDGFAPRLAGHARPGPAAPLAGPELTVVIPTYNERANVPLLAGRLARALDGIAWEAIFVDDNSPDGTAAALRTIAAQDSRIRCIRRVGRRGLAGACLEGMLASAAPHVAVIDADLQHDETLLPAMLEKLRGGDADLVAASRMLEGAVEGLSHRRAFASRASNFAARRLLGVGLHDPMSGFFMVRRDVVENLAPRLTTHGFKILLDIVTTAGPRLRVAEMPFDFARRMHGESKLDPGAALAFAELLFAKLTRDAVPFRFVLFCLVGLTGVAIHMSVLTLLNTSASLGFGADQAFATLAAIAWNFSLNNALTYRDRRLSGWRFAAGLLRFAIICSIGALSNVGIAAWIHDSGNDWWIAGLAGALVGAVWNYVVSAAYVWPQR